MKLNQHAKQALDTLSEKHLAYTIAKATIEAELKNELTERLASFKSERDIALRLADQAGVPRTQLGKAIGTTNYRTVQEVLEVTESFMHSEDSADGKWTLTAMPDGNYTLSIHSMGTGLVSGSAVVQITSDDLVFIDGDEFVIPQVYRNGYLEQIVQGAS
jgi:predicted transcriptional regulator